MIDPIFQQRTFKMLGVSILRGETPHLPFAIRTLANTFPLTEITKANVLSDELAAALDAGTSIDDPCRPVSHYLHMWWKDPFADPLSDHTLAACMDYHEKLLKQENAEYANTNCCIQGPFSGSATATTSMLTVTDSTQAQYCSSCKECSRCITRAAQGLYRATGSALQVGVRSYHARAQCYSIVE